MMDARALQVAITAWRRRAGLAKTLNPGQVSIGQTVIWRMSATMKSRGRVLHFKFETAVREWKSVMSFSIQRALQRFLRARHIELRKAPSVEWTPLPIFTLAVERAMQLRGEALRFIQVGANDGLYGDPLRHYILTRGWKGILCEPQEDVFAALQRNYSNFSRNLIFENVAIASSPDGMTLYRPPHLQAAAGAEMPHGLTVTSSKARVVAHQSGVAERDLVKITVPTLSLDALVDRHSFHGFDVLQIDVEGYDFEVMKTLSLDRNRPAVIQFEHGHLTPSELTDASYFLQRHGYLLYYGGRSTDSIAMPEELFKVQTRS